MTSITEALEFLQPTITVLEGCTREWVDEKSVEIENIEEDIFGQDVVTFKCNSCGEMHKSIRRG